jgi:hypothetical protein
MRLRQKDLRATQNAREGRIGSLLHLEYCCSLLFNNTALMLSLRSVAMVEQNSPALMQPSVSDDWRDIVADVNIQAHRDNSSLS